MRRILTGLAGLGLLICLGGCATWSTTGNDSDSNLRAPEQNTGETRSNANREQAGSARNANETKKETGMGIGSEGQQP